MDRIRFLSEVRLAIGEHWLHSFFYIFNPVSFVPDFYFHRMSRDPAADPDFMYFLVVAVYDCVGDSLGYRGLNIRHLLQCRIELGKKMCIRDRYNP